MLGKIIPLVLAILALLEGYRLLMPSLTVQEGTVLEQDNPYSQLFNVSNDALIPATELDAICKVTFSAPDMKLHDVDFVFTRFADQIRRGDRVTVPCFKTVAFNPSVEAIIRAPGRGPVTRNALLHVTITYAVGPLKMSRFRRTQFFRFRSIVSKDNHQQWESLPGVPIRRSKMVFERVIVTPTPSKKR